MKTTTKREQSVRLLPVREREVTWREPRFTGKKAFSPSTYLFAMAPLSVGSVIVDALPKGADTPLAWYASMGAMVAAGLVFLLVGIAANRVLPTEGIPRTIAVLAVYAMTEVLRTSLVGIALLRNGLDFDMMMHHRVVSGGLTGMLVLGIVSIVLNDRARYVAQFTELVERNHELERELKYLNDTIGEFVDDLRDTVSQVVDTAFSPIVSGFRTKQSVNEVVEDIVDLSEFVVRPLSTEIHDTLPRPRTVAEAPPRIRLPKLFGLTTTVSPFQPLSTAVVFFLLLAGAAVFTMPFPEGVIFLAASIGVTSGIHWLAVRFIGPHLLEWSGLVRVAVISTAYAIGPLVVVMALLAMRGGGMTTDRFMVVVYLVLVIEFISWALAVLPAVRRGHREILDQQAATMSELAQVRSRAEVKLRKEKQRLAAIVHGDIQSTLMATALKIQMPGNSPDDIDQIISDARETVAQVLQEAHLPEAGKTLDQVMVGLSESWLHIVTITWEAGPGVHVHVDADPDVSEILWQVVREAITNAVKHGKADTVDVSLGLDEENGHLVCRVVDNGQEAKTSSFAGGGSKLFHAVSDSYQRVRDGQRTILTVNIPLSHRTHRLPIRS